MEENIERCYKVLLKGGVILYQSDTLWGIGCDATNHKAVDRVYKIKKREETKSLIVLLDDIIKLDLYVEKIPYTAYDLINKYDNPLTIIYPKAKNIAKNLIGKDGSIAIRIVKDEFCRKLITLLNKPIVSTSANISGEAPPLTFSKINPYIIGRVDYVVGYHHDNINQLKASTIIKLSERGDFHVVRQ